MARTFFFATRAFYLNSTDGSSTSSRRALPNRGLNLNKIPNALIQTSDLQTAKYAEAGDFGDVVNLNRLALPAPCCSANAYSNTRRPRAPLRARGYPASTVTLASGAVVYANVVVQTTGLGRERSTASSARGREFADAEWTRFLEIGATPKYFSAGRFFQLHHQRAQPLRAVRGQADRRDRRRRLRQGDLGIPRAHGPAGRVPARHRRTRTLRTRHLDCAQHRRPVRAFVGAERTRYLRGIPAALQKGRNVGVPGVSQDVRPRGDGVELSYVTKNGAVQDDHGRRRHRRHRLRPPASGARNRRAGPLRRYSDTADAVIGTEVYPGAYLAGVAANARSPVKNSRTSPTTACRSTSISVRAEVLVDRIDELYRDSFGRFPALAAPAPAAPELGRGESVILRLINPNGRVQSRNFAKEFVEAQVAGALAQFDLKGEYEAQVEIEAQRDPTGAAVFRINAPVINGFTLATTLDARVRRGTHVEPRLLSVLDERVGDAARFAWTIRRDDQRVPGHVEPRRRRTRLRSPPPRPCLVCATRTAHLRDEGEDPRCAVGGRGCRLRRRQAPRESTASSTEPSCDARGARPPPARPNFEIEREARALTSARGPRRPLPAPKFAAMRPVYEAKTFSARWEKICAEAGFSVEEFRAAVNTGQSPRPRGATQVSRLPLAVPPIKKASCEVSAWLVMRNWPKNSAILPRSPRGPGFERAPCETPRRR